MAKVGRCLVASRTLTWTVALGICSNPGHGQNRFHPVPSPNRPLPPQVPDYEDRLSRFERMCVVKAFREDRTLLAAADYIADALGTRFVESVPLSMEVGRRGWRDGRFGGREKHSRPPGGCLWGASPETQSALERSCRRT